MFKHTPEQSPPGPPEGPPPAQPPGPPEGPPPAAQPALLPQHHLLPRIPPYEAPPAEEVRRIRAAENARYAAQIADLRKKLEESQAQLAALPNAATAREQNAVPEANAANQQPGARQQVVDALRQIPADRAPVYSPDSPEPEYPASPDPEYPAEPAAAVQTTAPKPPDEEDLVDYDE